jgi:hypothetical protein
VIYDDASNFGFTLLVKLMQIGCAFRIFF